MTDALCRLCRHHVSLHLNEIRCLGLFCTCTRTVHQASRDSIADGPQDRGPLTLRRKMWRALILSPFAAGGVAFAATLAAIWAPDIRLVYTATLFAFTAAALAVAAFDAWVRNEWPR